MNLHEAIRNGDTATAKRLIEEGASLWFMINYNTPAHAAAAEGNIEILELIKEHDGPINYIPCRDRLVKTKGRPSFKSTPVNSGPVGVAVAHDQLKVVKWFEQQDEIDFHNLGYGKRVSLEDAASNNAVNVTRYLARKGFELYIPNGYYISGVFTRHHYNQGIDAVLLLLSKGDVFRLKALPFEYEKFYALGSYILKDPEVFLKCGNTVLENLAGGLNILSTCLREQKEPEIKEYAESMLPNLMHFIRSNDFNFKVLGQNCKTVDDIQELSFQADKVLEIYERNKSYLSILSEVHKLLLSTNPKILELKEDAKQLEIKSIECGFFKLGFQEGLEETEKGVYKKIISLKPELFIELLDYFDPQRTSCLSELELLDSGEYDIEAVGEAEG
ncbi:hypothetical protein phytr_1540 [Candidatus Phycorickettsia trachydisci]|uniref:Ankyrin repeat-containing protein n=1 Tax=Candidatus Phycorickettsia trachydisci TaxID=2115978 RepID=A0A2P1P769_9RICK|nr:ankyrin repeat domain-containing protein [Candidatus Phycorickettsia trachydisci]AVP87113.1 hypothetical protein phytr_1540 [Candidatus Phycorickettsia trachydisci]